MARSPSCGFGSLLREWRALRGMSQLALAGEARTTTRHVSFLETGRATPSREMVVRLAEALDVPLRERNALLEAGGFAPLYRQHRIDDAEIGPIRRVIALLLESAEPFPAVAVDRAYDVVMTNAATTRLLGLFLRPDDLLALGKPNLIRMTFHPQGMHRFIQNWAEAGPMLLGRLHREAQRLPPSDPLHRLLEEVTAYTPIPSEYNPPKVDRALPPVVALHLKRDEFEARLFGTITTLGTPQDVTLQELRIETFLPADSPTEELARRLATQNS